MSFHTHNGWVEIPQALSQFYNLAYFFIKQQWAKEKTQM